MAASKKQKSVPPAPSAAADYSHEDEAATRLRIDAQLRQAGWEVNTKDLTFASGARPQRGLNRAIAEWPTSSGPADWRQHRVALEPATLALERSRTERRERWEQATLAKMLAKGSPPTNTKWKKAYRPPLAVPKPGPTCLPRSWCWATAEELTAPGRPIMYGIIKPGPHYPQGVPYVRVTEILNRTVDIASLRRCNPARAALFSRATLRSGDILISKDGTIGRIAIVPPELEGGNITQHVLRLSPTSHVNREFLAWMLEAPASQAWMKGETRGVALQGVNVEDFRRLPIPLAPLSEQEEIVRRLEAGFANLQAAAKAQAAAISELDHLNHSLLAKAFNGDLVPQDPNDESASVFLQRITAERKTRAEELKKQPRKTMIKKKEPTAEKRDLLAVLADHPEGLTPDQLLTAAGYKSDEIPDFYQHLRRAERGLQESRPDRKTVLLKRRSV